MARLADGQRGAQLGPLLQQLLRLGARGVGRALGGGQQALRLLDARLLGRGGVRGRGRGRGRDRLGSRVSDRVGVGLTLTLTLTLTLMAAMLSLVS